MIRLESVTKRFPNGNVAVHELSIDVPDGDVCVLVGPSGCGKTTTLRMINRLIEPTAGRIFLGDEDVTHANPVELRRRMGYVIQQVGLFPHQTIGTNVATVPHLLGWSRDKAKARANELLELVGLDPGTYRDRYPAQLSGGQRQRVGVARALAADPPVLLMDEPFGAIDPVTRARLQDEFLRIQREIAKTIVFVTHDIDEAVKMGDRIAIFEVGGVLAQYDVPADVLGNPANDFVADFVGSDRGLKRLKVMPIADAELEHPPTVGRDDSLAAVRDAMDRAGTTYAVMPGDDGNCLAIRQRFASGDGVAADRARPLAVVGTDRSLEDALASILLTDEGVVAVADGRAYRGTLTLDAVYGALRTSRHPDKARP
ncbi:MAG TPA: ATP-binding cassette domain-containing protein [Acidimicrobiia bacterium]